MALDLSPLLIDHNARPYHLQVLADIYDGQTEDAYEALDQSAAIATLKGDIQILTDAQEAALAADLASLITHIDNAVNATSLSGPDKTSLKAAIAVLVNGDIVPANYFDPLQTDIEDAIDTDISAGVEVNKSDVLEAIKAELIAIIAADATNFPAKDPWCNGLGQYEKRRDAGADPTDTDLKHCNVCDGFGYAPAKTVTIIKPPLTTYPE